MTKKRSLIQMLCTGCCTALLLFASGLHVCAQGSVQDVYDALERCGYPQSMITMFRTQFENTKHDENGMSVNGTYYTYKQWADLVDVCQEQIYDEFAKKFGITPEELRKQDLNSPGEAHSDENGKSFASMTLDEKKAYIASLPEADRAAFLASLSPEERRSIIKQLDPESQANIMQGFLDVAENLGIQATVGFSEDGSMNYALRDGDGNLIGASSVGITVDPTGWDMTLPVLLSCGMIFTAASGFFLLAKQRREGEKSYNG